MADDLRTEANIRRAAFSVYDYVTAFRSNGDDISWCRIGPFTPELRARLAEMTKMMCGNCDMTPYLDQVWDKLCRIMQTFGEPR